MTYFPTTRIKTADSPSADAFDRYRVSMPYTIFDSKQISNSGSFFWSTKFVSGGSGSYNQNAASSTYSVTAVSGSRAIKQTKQRFFYQPGKSLLCLATFNMKQFDSGVIKRVGYFDDLNGVYLEKNGANVNMVIRSSVTGGVTETRVSQSNWNIDRIDGTGESAKTIDLTKVQIFSIDLQWLGVGRVRTGFNIDGLAITAHEFYHANIDEQVYMSTPNLPIRYEIENFAGTNSGSLEQICSSVLSEGGFDPQGLSISENRGVSGLAISNGKLAPVISLRLRSDKLSTTVFPTGTHVFTTDNASFRWCLYLNPTFGSDAASWRIISGSSVEYDISRTQNNVLTGGLCLQSGYAGSFSKDKVTTTVDQSSLTTGLSLGSDLNGNLDELVLAVELISTGSSTVYGSIDWKEIT